ncbi:glycosyltransferase family 2 protein [Mucilaginibacter myungsuensis]|uniref:Glycosyltransferase family 2 protein n=1 Tax=Mucilaginibacter myungsuensis TaxID=649104 RepID=A0A929L2K7_9SPHI|nr:glycosyltransferase family 2 protein [Mucilaginibacter myungsuensis]MBE9662071.1 glycosyltransferase family 2 protein [Mucilaginibacter myungsuensis]MDN3599495.1 glycosyltransferase family 2 protein [Mucilaginibacter myungsuensis]
MKKVSIVTVNFNQAAVTMDLLRSIAQTNTYPDLEVIVVDNGSKHNPGLEIAAEYPDVKFIATGANLGFAGGNNVGIKAATGDYYFLVNNDTEFIPGLVQKLVDTLDEHPEVGAVSPRIHYFDDQTLIQYVNFTQMNYYTCANSSPGQFQRNGDDYNTVVGPVGYAHGAAMMVKREATDKVGLMYENYFLYYEEMDWAERIKRAGYQIWMRGDALIYHKESVSVGRNSWLKEYFMNRNRILFIRRNAPALKALFFYFYYMLLVVPRNIINYIRSGNANFTGYLLKAIWWNVTNKTDSTDLGITLSK